MEDRAGGVDTDGGGPGSAVRGPVHRGIRVEGVSWLQRQAGLAPAGPTVEGVELRLATATADVVGRGDDPARVPVVDPDVGFAALARLRTGDPLFARRER